MSRLIINQQIIKQYPTLHTFIEMSTTPMWDQLDWRSELTNTYRNCAEMDGCAFDLNLVSICAVLKKEAHLTYLATHAPHQTKALLQESGYFPYYYAAANGWLDMIQHLERIAPGETEAMIAEGDYSAYREAAANNHLDVMLHMEQKAPDKIPEMIQSGNYAAYREAALHGFVGILQHLEHQAPYSIRNMVAANDYEAYRSAAFKGHLSVLEHLENIASELTPAMIKTNSYEAYRRAAANNQLAILQHLETRLPHHIEQMLHANNFNAYLSALREDHSPVIQHLLSHSCILAYAEAREHELGSRYIRHYIKQQLNALQTQKLQFEQRYPKGIFDISDNQVSNYFYSLRHLIRRNDPSTYSHINELLLLPSLHHKALARNDNELLRLALKVGNNHAASTLLLVPAVKERLTARPATYDYRLLPGKRSLPSFIHSKEPPLLFLNRAERNVIMRVQAHYQDKMAAMGGISMVIGAFKNFLESRYESRPATIKLAAATLALPFSWSGLQRFKTQYNLTSQQYQTALKAYYQHPEHTALRYLLKPNPWMDDQAAYVYTEQRTTMHWSTFESYIPMIAYFWLAASDEATPPIDNYTLEGRKDLFIRQLALIGRAHNWDKTRDKRRSGGRIQREEYDDLEGDRPACFSGVNQRLFQSVLGHPLFDQLSRERLRQEIHSFVREHFKVVLAEENHQAVQVAFMRCITLENSEEDLAYLARFNLSEHQLEHLHTALTTKYGNAFSDDPLLQQQFHETFRLDNLRRNHFEIFYNCLRLDTLLKTGLSSSLSEHSMFAPTTAQAPSVPIVKQKSSACNIL